MPTREICLAKTIGFWTAIWALLLMSSTQGLKAGSDHEPRNDRPNIILIMADDLGYSGLGCYGQELIQTPRIDQLAEEGLMFTDVYAANTVCVPSRVGLITGRHPGHATIRDNLRPHVDIEKENAGGYMNHFPKWAWPPSVKTLGRVLKDAGYRTGQFGKLEVGIPMEAGKMAEHGWDTWMGFKGTGAAFQYYPTVLWKNERKIEYPSNQAKDVRRPGIVGDKGVYSPDVFLKEIKNFIRTNQDQPFFLYFPSQVPHGRSPRDGDEIQVPDIGPYADREWSHLEKLYAAMMTRFDTDVGEIMDLLQELDLDENTIIFFTSDNGDENSYYKYTDRFKANGPLRGKKRYLYEGGIRVPMIVRWPGKVEAGGTSNLPWAAWDLMATFAELAGVSPPKHTDGISVVPTLLDTPEKQTKREYLYWEYHQGKQQAVRMGHWKAVRIGGTEEPIELYDLRTEIGEANDIAGAHPEIVSRMQQIMKEAREESEFSEFWPIPERRRDDIKFDNWIYDKVDRGAFR